MIASTWSALVDVAAGVVGLLVLGLLRAVWGLAERVTRLEEREESRRRRVGA